MVDNYNFEDGNTPNPYQQQPMQQSMPQPAMQQPNVQPMPQPAMQQQYMPQQPTQPPSYPEPPKGTSGLAIAGLVLGIIAAATSFMPIINNASFFIGLIGLVLSIIGLVGINKGKHKGRGLAIAGIALGAISLVIVLATQAACSAALDSLTDSPKSPSAPAASSSAGTAQKQGGSPSASASSTGKGAPEYEVSIDSAAVSSDYAGNPVLVVTFSWKNNSDDAKSFATALHSKCYQNGVQLDVAIGARNYDGGGYLADVKPGSGTTVQLAYELEDKSPVEVEVSKLLSFDDSVLASKTFTIS